MSYILDALKKSERERPPGTVPDLFTVHGPQSQPPSPRWPTRAIVAVALLLAVPAIVLCGLDRNGSPRRGCRPAPRRRSAATARRGPDRAGRPRARSPRRRRRPRRDVAAAARRPRRRTAASRRRRPSAAVARRPSLQPLSPTPGPAANSDPCRPGTRLAAPPRRVPVSPAPAPVVSAPPDMLPATGGRARSPGSSRPGGVRAPTSEETPPADGRVLDLAELPAPIRAGLPKLLVSGHVWSEEPSLRLLSVDDRLLHEGGEAAPGVSLQEITPAGAVFVFKGWHFRVAGGRP